MRYWLIYILLGITIASCERRPLEEELYITARIPVKIDWSNSGINPATQSATDDVHRVSIRFFPKDGSVPFDRYLNVNVFEGEIEVPLGSYSVVVFNEGIEDRGYWGDHIYFTDVNNYSQFAANLVEDKSRYDYYPPHTQEMLAVEPLKLASWSADDYEITPETITRTRTKAKPGQQPDDTLRVSMRSLFYQSTVVARVTNLNSALDNGIHGALQGFANKVYMASGLTEQSPSTFLFRFNNRKWDDASKTNGTTEFSFLTFGLLPAPAQYGLFVDILTADGKRYVPVDPLQFDITNQIDVQINISIGINIEVKIELPVVKGGIKIDDWDNDEIIIIN